MKRDGLWFFADVRGCPAFLQYASRSTANQPINETVTSREIVRADSRFMVVRTPLQYDEGMEDGRRAVCNSQATRALRAARSLASISLDTSARSRTRSWFACPKWHGHYTVCVARISACGFETIGARSSKCGHKKTPASGPLGLEFSVWMRLKLKWDYVRRLRTLWSFGDFKLDLLALAKGTKTFGDNRRVMHDSFI